jgi:hypothetical protein
VLIVIHMGPGPGGSSQGKDDVLREIDGVTRALKVAMLQMEGAVDMIRSELRATKVQDDQKPGRVETSWNPELGGEIVVDEFEGDESSVPLIGTPTAKVSILNILDQLPSHERSEAGFTSEVFHDLLVRLEKELEELRGKIESAVIWVKHLKEKTDTGFVLKSK